MEIYVQSLNVLGPVVQEIQSGNTKNAKFYSLSFKQDLKCVIVALFEYVCMFSLE